MKLSTSTDSVLVVYGAGYGTKLEAVVSSYEGIADSADPTTWAQLKESYSEQLEYYIAQLNSQIEEYDPYSLNE